MRPLAPMKVCNLQEILAKNAPAQTYIVGGILRDSVMKRPCGDIDLALLRAHVKPFALKLARRLGASAFEMDPEFCVWRVSRKDGLQIDLSAIVGRDIKEDLKRRDFTVNALAYPLSAPFKIRIKKSGQKPAMFLEGLRDKELIDLNGGLEDIPRGVIRAVGEKAFCDDPLRLLRAFRAAAELNFNVSPKTLAYIKKHAELISQAAGERKQEELKKIFRQPRSRFWLEQMDKARLLASIFPDLEAQKQCAQCYYGKGGVFEHTLTVVERIEYLLGNLKTVFPKFHKRIKKYAQDAALYKMAALLHDIAKPDTAKEVGGRLRFFFHEEKGAKKADGVLRELKYPCAQIKQVYNMTRHHMRIGNLAANDTITDRGIYKLFKELGECVVPVLLLCWADYTGYAPAARLRGLIKKSFLPVMSLEEGKKYGAHGKTLRHLQVINFLFKKYFSENKKLVAPVRLVDGKDIMDVLKIPSCPKIGEILEDVAAAQVEGKIKTRQDALDYLRSFKN
jgi:poly(A) polymerase